MFAIRSDNGKEFANPYSPWQRGANENLKGLIRQYISKSASFEEISDERIIEIQEKLNNRPRKRCNFKTPNYMFNQKVAFTT